MRAVRGKLQRFWGKPFISGTGEQQVPPLRSRGFAPVGMTMFVQRTSARIRTGPSDPLSSLVGATTTMLPAAGARSRLATFSSW